jgi:hypothetical protein
MVTDKYEGAHVFVDRKRVVGVGKPKTCLEGCVTCDLCCEYTSGKAGDMSSAS